MTLAEAVRAAAARLREAGCDAPDLDSRILAEEAFGLGRAALIAGGTADPDGCGRLNALVERRAGGEPVARILGRREFWGLDFALAPETLVPRPDTETVVETALAEIGPRDRFFSMLDLGTGTGCLLLAVLAERPQAEGVGVDLSPGAASKARANAETLGLGPRARFVVGRWGAALGRRFDLVTSNPPYIASADIGGLDREVSAHDPHLALDGGADGLEAYRAIAAGLDRLLAEEGVAVLELGIGQREAVSAIATAAGFAATRAAADPGGVPRALVLRRAR